MAFLVADVSGKGITAAVFMVKAKTLLKGYAEKECDVADILRQANKALCKGNNADMFVTCRMDILDFAAHTVTFANAGHNAPLVRRSGGSLEYFKSLQGFALGGMEGIKYRMGELSLNRDDEIYLYTDGVTEATNAGNKLYGDVRLHHILNTLSDASAEEICQAVRGDVDRFAGDAPQFDNMTMLYLRLIKRKAVTLTPSKESMAEALDFLRKPQPCGCANEGNHEYKNGCG